MEKEAEIVPVHRPPGCFCFFVMSFVIIIVSFTCYMISLQVLSLGDSEQRVAELVGATESLLSRRATGQRVKKVQVLLFSSRNFAFFFSLCNLPNRVSFYTDVFWACQTISGKGFCDESKESLSRSLNLMLVFVIQSFNCFSIFSCHLERLVAGRLVGVTKGTK